ncbi:MAG: DUF368 domain-containing protein [Ruminococcus sp.]|nr:DUF368 domain-containing protein [Ruminococcus sp.]
MDFLLIIKGFVVGLGKIIPGISGSMLAITLGIYENIIDAITNFFSNVKKNSKLLINFGIGVFLAIIFFSKLILFLLSNYYYETMYLFLGLIMGTLLPFVKKVKITKKNVFLFFITIIIMFLLLTKNNSNTFYFNDSFIHYLYISLLGVIDAFTSIIPGISGTAIFMILGSYELVLNVLANPFNLMFIIYFLGLIIGVIVISFIMNYLFKNKKEETYSVILALMLSSLIILFLKLLEGFNITSLIIFIIGGFLGFLFDK